MEKYAQFGYKESDSINKFIDYFSAKYDEFSPRELVKFCENLALFSLDHKDIFESVISSIKEF